MDYFLRLAVDLSSDGRTLQYHISSIGDDGSTTVCHWLGAASPNDETYLLMRRLENLVAELGLVQEPFPA